MRLGSAGSFTFPTEKWELLLSEYRPLILAAEIVASFGIGLDNEDAHQGCDHIFSNASEEKCPTSWMGGAHTPQMHVQKLFVLCYDSLPTGLKILALHAVLPSVIKLCLPSGVVQHGGCAGLRQIRNVQIFMAITGDDHGATNQIA